MLISLSTTCYLIFCDCYADHRDLHSFPTRRSSDLTPYRWGETGRIPCRAARRRRDTQAPARRPYRSEEHTSELQSLRHLVCRLLLEKKKKIQKYSIPNSTQTCDVSDNRRYSK